MCVFWLYQRYVLRYSWQRETNQTTYFELPPSQRLPIHNLWFCWVPICVYLHLRCQGNISIFSHLKPEIRFRTLTLPQSSVFREIIVHISIFIPIKFQSSGLFSDVYYSLSSHLILLCILYAFSIGLATYTAIFKYLGMHSLIYNLVQNLLRPIKQRGVVKGWSIWCHSLHVLLSSTKDQDWILGVYTNFVN